MDQYTLIITEKQTNHPAINAAGTLHEMLAFKQQWQSRFPDEFTYMILGADLIESTT